jgi:hypothetical protein
MIYEIGDESPNRPGGPITPIETLELIGSCMTCLGYWTDLVSDLTESPFAAHIDTDEIAARVASLAAIAKATYRQVEAVIVK